MHGLGAVGITRTARYGMRAHVGLLGCQDGGDVGFGAAGGWAHGRAWAGVGVGACKSDHAGALGRRVHGNGRVVLSALPQAG